jgi:DNA (cytosine-5)-methyltransferase 1
MSAYYNEFDPFAAAWLRELIKAGHIAPGDVDERSIKDVKADDLRGYTQCHFFAGIGVWSHALRSAGWSDERPVWTGSCPCQPFSAAGKGGGFDDERHLWPDFFRLIAECRPDVVLGEQVASKDGLGWLDLVYADLEGTDYAVGAVDTCAAGFGAPHIRQRLYWTGTRLADTESAGKQREFGNAQRAGRQGVWAQQERPEHDRSSADGGLADAVRDGAEHGPRQGVGAQTAADRGDGGVSGERLWPWEQGALRGLGDTPVEPRERVAGSVLGAQAQVGGKDRQQHGHLPVGPEYAGAGVGGLADANGRRPQQQPGDGRSAGLQSSAHGETKRLCELGDVSASIGERPGPTNGLWRDADWLGCRDGKWRPVEPGTFPLAHGATARVGRLRGYGNAIVSEQAKAFVEAVMSCS